MSSKKAYQSSVADLLNSFSRYPLLTRDEEFALGKRYAEQKDPEAAQKLITANLQNVVHIALDYMGYKMPIEDIIQEGMLGLIIAVEKFDPNKGYRLMTYAVWWIKAMIHDYIFRFYSLVKLGTTSLEKQLFYKMNHMLAEESLSDGNFSEKSHVLASKLHADQRQIEKVLSRIVNRDHSLDNPVAKGSSTSFLDFVEDGGTNPEDQLIASQQKSYMKDKINNAVANLSQREQEITRKRLLAEDPETLCELSQKLTISKERVRQIENGVMNKFKQALGEHYAAIS